MSVSRGAKSATLTTLPSEVQQTIYQNLPPIEIAALAVLTTTTATVINDANLWATISKRALKVIPKDPSPSTVREFANKLISRWWLLTGLFVPGVPVHRRSGFSQVSARGGVELPIVHPEKESCYVFGGQHEAAALPVLNPAVSLCFFLDPNGLFPVDGMRLSIVHTVEIPEEHHEITLSYLNLGPPANSDQLVLHCEEPYASVTVRLNNDKLLTNFRPKPGNFQVTHIHVPPHLLVTKPRMNHISVEYDRSSTAAYWLKQVSIMPSILPPPPDEKTVTAIRIGEPLPHPQPTHSLLPSQPHVESPPTRRHNQTHNHTHRRPVRRLTERSLKKHVSEPQPYQRLQKVQHVTATPKHMYHHYYFRSPRRSSPTSPKTRSTR